MALSRAAAVAARKAAKARGLQGNRGEDGSMLSQPANVAGMEARSRGYDELSDTELVKMWNEKSREIEELEDLGTVQDTTLELAEAREELEIIQDALDDMGVLKYDEGLYQSDVDEYMGRVD